MSDWQKCPKCDGQGTVSKPPYIAGDVYEWSGTSSQFQCNVCNGRMIIHCATGMPPSVGFPPDLTESEVGAIIEICKK
jgi:hypothetical protein